MLSIGDYTLHTLDVQDFSLDGGSVFGVVPRVLWEKVIAPDHLNRVRLPMRILSFLPICISITLRGLSRRGERSLCRCFPTHVALFRKTITRRL